MKIIASLMFKRLIVMGIFFTLVFTMGCTLPDPKTNPSYSVIPEVLIDYDSDVEEIKIWVKSALSDFKYDSIRAELSNEKQTIIDEQNNTYCFFISTKLKAFNLTINVLSDEGSFEYFAKVELDFIEEYLITITTYEQEEKKEIIKQDDFPYKKLLEEL